MGLVLYSSTEGKPPPSSREPLLLDGRDDCPEFLSSFFGGGGGGGGGRVEPADHADHAYLADLVAHNRHLPPSGTQRHDWRCGPSKARLSARRQIAWASRYEYEYHDQIHHMREESEVDLLRHNAGGLWPRRLRPHQIRLLQRSTSACSKRWYECDRDYGGSSMPHVRGQRQSVRDACLNEMAAYQPRAPCPERSRPAPPVTTPAWTRSARRVAEDSDSDRPPSLERQGAFRDATTTKRRLSESLDPDEAELYRLGLLYDNEHACGASFDLDAIVHDAPLYTVSAGRQRGRARGRSPRSPRSPRPPRSESEDLDLDPSPVLQLGLSFANLADDAALARFLQDEEMAAYLAAVPEVELKAELEAEAAAAAAAVPDLSFSPASSSSLSRPSVRVIYELAPEVEADTETASLPALETDSSHDSDAGDWVMDMDPAGERDDDASVDNDNSSLLFRTADDTDSNPDDTWLLLRP